VVAILAVAAASGWTLLWIGPPPALTLAGTAVAWLLLALLARSGRGLALGAVLALATALAPSSPPDLLHREGAPAARGPDIILLTVDTLRADAAREMRAYRRLARAGTEYASAQASAPWTLPSLATTLTGQPSSAHGAGRLGAGGNAPIRETVPTLATLLSEHGYDTAAVIGPNAWVGRRFGFGRGFHLFEHTLQANRYAIPRLDRLGGAYPVIAELVSLAIRGRRPVGGADELTRRAIDLLELGGRPLFLWVQFFDPHLSYRHADETDLPWATRMRIDIAVSRTDMIGDAHWSTEEGVHALRTAYRHEVERVDRAILRLLDYLAERPERGRVVVLTSDHGEEFLDHGQFEHGHAFYQEVVGIPLVIAAPNAPRSGRAVEDSPVGLVDIGATLLEHAGLGSHPLPGQRLGEPVEIRPYLIRNLLYGGAPDDRFAVRRGPWKAIFGPDGAAELYDLTRDPGETVDRARAHPELVESLRKQFSARPTDDSKPAELSEDELRALRALGYVE
jgi:arylsulfatase A-like enzyme